MNTSKWVAASVGLLLGTSVLFAIEPGAATNAPATQPAHVVKHHGRNLPKPWSEVAGLSDEQKTKIELIHQTSLDEQNRIKDKEKEDILATLTDDQKAELQKIEEKKAAELKQQRHKKPEATTEPVK